MIFENVYKNSFSFYFRMAFADVSDSVSCLKFSPPTQPRRCLIATSWDKNLYCWTIGHDLKPSSAIIKSHPAILLSAAWSSDGTKVFTGSCDYTAKMWDLQSDQLVQVGCHDASIKSIHHVRGHNYECIMTGSWDKTLKFWDTRQQSAIYSIQLPDKCYCADVCGTIAIISGANNFIKVYSLDQEPREVMSPISLLTKQHRCVSILASNNVPVGFAIGSIDGKIAIQYFNTNDQGRNFLFDCHRRLVRTNEVDIFPINDMLFHPKFMTLASVGGDGRFCFWNVEKR